MNERQVADVGRAPCPHCPFRRESPLSYDEDSILALDEGHEPSCHSVVGFKAIFEDSSPDDESRCVGCDLWLVGEPGFRKPGTRSCEVDPTVTLKL